MSSFLYFIIGFGFVISLMIFIRLRKLGEVVIEFMRVNNELTKSMIDSRSLDILDKAILSGNQELIEKVSKKIKEQDNVNHG